MSEIHEIMTEFSSLTGLSPAAKTPKRHLWTETDTGGRDGPRSVGKGAETVLWLATGPDKGPTGGFFRDKKRIK